MINGMPNQPLLVSKNTSLLKSLIEAAKYWESGGINAGTRW
jgi:hypothetical protein